jgi:hypothetical protein
MWMMVVVVTLTLSLNIFKTVRFQVFMAAGVKVQSSVILRIVISWK